MEGVIELVYSNPYVVTAFVFVVFLSLLTWAGVRFDRQQQRKSTVGIKNEVGNN